MKKLVLLLLAVAGSLTVVNAQDDLFGTEKKEPRKGWVIQVHGGLDFPVADMAERFGTSYRLGGGFFYKTKKNWVFGPTFDFILGNQIKEPGFMRNIDPDGSRSLLGQGGIRQGYGVFERGYTIGLQAGKIFNNILSNSPDNGLMLLTTVGFIQHKILIFDRDEVLPAIRDDYKKGYDRLANGLYIEQFAGYNHFGKNGFLNFNIGINVLAGFTKGRRDYLFDTRQAGTDSRLDMLVGLKGSWYIPIFRKKSEELFFE